MGVAGASILLALVLWPSSGCAHSHLHTLSHLLSPGKRCLHRKRKLKVGPECTPVACRLLRGGETALGLGLTYDHVLQRVLGQPAVEEHGDEQVPKGRPEDLWCVGERSGGAWGAKRGVRAHPP